MRLRRVGNDFCHLFGMEVAFAWHHPSVVHARDPGRLPVHVPALAALPPPPAVAAAAAAARVDDEGILCGEALPDVVILPRRPAGIAC